MEVRAKAKFIRISPKKVRLLVDLIRGLDVEEALVQLQFSKKHSSLPIATLLKSAIANAEENDDLKRNNLFVREITVDGGPTLKRWMPKAMGRATPLIKRSSHITVVLAEKIPTTSKKKVKKEDTKDDIIKIEDLGKISHEDKKEDKKSDGGSKRGGSVNKKTGNKLFNRRTGS